MRKMMILVCCGLGLVAFTGIGVGMGEPDVSGTVLDPTGKPWEGVQVSLIDSETAEVIDVARTDNSGSYSFLCVPNGYVDLIFELQGAITQSLHRIKTEYPRQPRLEFNVQMLLAPGYTGGSLPEPMEPQVIFHIAAGDTDAPLAESEITIEDLDSSLQPQLTDGCGRSWTFLKLGVRYSATVRRVGYKPYELSFSPNAERPLIVRVALEADH